jgi:hypothetical protein
MVELQRPEWLRLQARRHQDRTSSGLGPCNAICAPICPEQTVVLRQAQRTPPARRTAPPCRGPNKSRAASSIQSFSKKMIKSADSCPQPARRSRRARGPRSYPTDSARRPTGLRCPRSPNPHKRDERLNHTHRAHSPARACATVDGTRGRELETREEDRTHLTRARDETRESRRRDARRPHRQVSHSRFGVHTHVWLW